MTDVAEAVVTHPELVPDQELPPAEQVDEELTIDELLKRVPAEAVVVVSWDSDGDMRLSWRNCRPPRFWAAAEYLRTVGTTMFHEGRAAALAQQQQVDAVRMALTQDHLGKKGIPRG